MNSEDEMDGKKNPFSISLPFYATLKRTLRINKTHLRQGNHSLLISLGLTFRTGCRNSHSTPEWCAPLTLCCLCGTRTDRKVDRLTHYLPHLESPTWLNHLRRQPWKRSMPNTNSCSSNSPQNGVRESSSPHPSALSLVVFA